VTCQVSRFAAQSSTTVSVTATGVSAGTPRITYAISSVEPDLAPNDNTGTVRIEVRDPDESSGSTGPLFLWLLSLAALVRRRR
jgi:MYXO-CTERM domain-containing protein